MKKTILLIAALLLLAPVYASAWQKPWDGTQLAIKSRNSNIVEVGGAGAMVTGSGAIYTNYWDSIPYVAWDAWDSVYTSSTDITRIDFMIPNGVGFSASKIIFSTWRAGANCRWNIGTGIVDATKITISDVNTTGRTFTNNTTSAESFTLSSPLPAIMGDFIGRNCTKTAGTCPRVVYRTEAFSENISQMGLAENSTSTNQLMVGDSDRSWACKMYGRAPHVVVLTDSSGFDQGGTGTTYAIRRKTIAGGAVQMTGTYDQTGLMAYWACKPFGFVYSNLGTPGEDTVQIRARYTADATNHFPKYVIMLMGGNNYLSGTISSIIPDISAMVAEAIANNSIPVVVSMCPMNAAVEGSFPGRGLALYAKNLEIAAIKTIYPQMIYVDIQPLVGTLYPGPYYILDAIYDTNNDNNLNAAAQKIMGNAVASAIYKSMTCDPGKPMAWGKRW